MSAVAVSELFYVSGGTMPEEALSYVERAADRHLLDSLLSGKFCYVLNSRQMGKSSMCVRTKRKLEEQGVRTAFIDLTKIGGKNVTAEQWYAGLIVEVGRALGLRAELLEYWKDNSHLSPLQRFFGGIREVILEKIQPPVVIFVDEIDSTRSLPFDTDEFFAGIRECYNRRVHDPVYNRLTFCLLGVAVPSDLIRNAQTTPFNIGERIYLKDFTLEEATSLARGLPGRESLVNRIHYWTHGHPFLTQSICTAIRNDASIKSDAGVDALVSRELFEPKAKETNINLADVGNRVLNGYAEGDDIAKFRADILSAYQKAISGKTELQDDESNRTTAVLKLSGLMRSEGKALKVRNPIYERVFGKDWIKENMPGQEMRRQRRAFFLGVLRTATVAIIVIAVIAYLAIQNHNLALKAAAQARENQYQAYVATMDLMPVIYDQKNIARMRQLLSATKDSPWKNVEWYYWHRLAHEAVVESPPTGLDAYAFSLSDDDSQIVVGNGPDIDFYSTKDGSLTRTIHTNYRETSTAAFIPHSNRILLLMSGGGGSVVDGTDGKELLRLPADFGTINPYPPFVQGGAYLLGETAKTGPVKINLTTGDATPLHVANVGNVRAIGISPDGVRVAGPLSEFGVIGEFDVVANKQLAQYKLPFTPTQVGYLHDGHHLIVGGSDGEVALLNTSTGKVESQIKISEPATSFSVSKDDSLVGFTIRRRAAGLIDIKDHKLVFRRWFPEANVSALFADKSRLVTLYTNIKLYDTSSPPLSPTLQLGPGPWGARYRRSDGKTYLSAASDVTGSVSVYQVQDGKLISDRDLSRPGLIVLSTDPNYFYMVLASGNKINVCDFHGKVVLPLKGYGQHVSVSRGGDYLAVTLDGYKIDIYDFKSGALKTSIQWPKRIAALTFDWQGKHLAVGEEGGSGGMIDANGWKVLWDHGMHAQGIRSGRFSEDGTLIITCGEDDCARLWDVETGKKLQDFYGHAQSVTDGDITADKKRLITVSDDQTIRVWDTATGNEVTTLGELPGLPLVCQITSSGKYVLTADSSGQVKFWPITEQ